MRLKHCNRSCSHPEDRSMGTKNISRKLDTLPGSNNSAMTLKIKKTTKNLLLSVLNGSRENLHRDEREGKLKIGENKD